MKPTIAHQRLYHQRISHKQFKTPSEAVAWLGAMQAQDYLGALWSIGLRLSEKCTDKDVEQDILDKKIVRTWPMRGTLHFVAAEDLRWMLALTGRRYVETSSRRYGELELDEKTLARSNDLLAKALRDVPELDRHALLAVLEANGISTAGQRGVWMLGRASADGLIVQGVMRRNVQTYFAIDDSIPRGKTLARDEALAELTLRYFTSHGPAAAQDFVWWSGLVISDVRAGIDSVKSKLVEETIDGKTYWMSPEMAQAPQESPSVYGLSGFDEFLLAYSDKSAALTAEFRARWSRKNAMFSPTIVSDG
ncbi:MAG: AlkZ family DNA glycosylase, partial [Burkholderiales bacterium]|nr:AlkZ family DNA glycosylase [Anaerolineae bacterium]